MVLVKSWLKVAQMTTNMFKSSNHNTIPYFPEWIEVTVGFGGVRVGQIYVLCFLCCKCSLCLGLYSITFLPCYCQLIFDYWVSMFLWYILPLFCKNWITRSWFRTGTKGILQSYTCLWTLNPPLSLDNSVETIVKIDSKGVMW